MNNDVSWPFASRWELKEALSSIWSCAGDSVWPPLAPGWAWPVLSSSLTSWPVCSTVYRQTICPPSLASPLYLPLSPSRPVISRRCAPCSSIQSLRSTPNDFLALSQCNKSKPDMGTTYEVQTSHASHNPLVRRSDGSGVIGLDSGQF